MYDEGNEGRERRARSHLVRVAILAVLAKDDRELTAAQVRAKLAGNPPLRNVHYHLRILKASRLVIENGDCYKLA